MLKSLRILLAVIALTTAFRRKYLLPERRARVLCESRLGKFGAISSLSVLRCLTAHMNFRSVDAPIVKKKSSKYSKAVAGTCCVKRLPYCHYSLFIVTALRR
jgi:hypothetical protein